MGQLGDVLELFFGPADPFRTVQATIRESQDMDLTEAADSAASVVWGRRKAVAKKQRVRETAFAVWMAPNCARIEERSQKDPDAEPLI